MVFTVGCNKNPYPEEGLFTTTPPATPDVVRPAISADIPDNVDFKEGKETAVTLRAVVPGPGKPVVTIEKLPEGAVFNAENLTLTWTPDFSAGNVANDPMAKVNIYPVVVWVRSSEDEVQAVRKSMNLVVYDRPRAINVISEETFEVTESQSGSLEFTVENEDYAKGPFDISLGDFPPNVVLVKLTDKKYRIDLAPDYQHVNVRQHTSCYNWKGACREYQSRIVASNPAGHKVEKKVKIKVIDKRIAPKAVAVEELEQGLDVNFQVGGYDLNSEVSPSIELLSRTPEVGKFKIDNVQDDASYSTVARVSWTDLPPSMNGTQTTFGFKVCALNESGNRNNCSTKTVKVTVKIQERLGPLINRSSWTIGEMKYLNFRQSADYKVDVIDAHDRRLRPVVEIFPESMRQFVSWRNGLLSVNFSKAGIFQFNLVATSQYGVKSIEGFVVEVFPETRGQVLLLSDSSRDKEVQFYRKHFQNLEVVNPFLQDLGVRLLSGRKTLVVGTSVLADPESKTKVKEASDAIRNIVVASSLVQNLPDSLYKQITDDFRITVVGRYLDIPRLPALSEMSFVTRQDFAVPKAPLTLGQSATVESLSPVIFSTGVDTNNCDDVLEIADALRLNRLKVGIICDRPRGGRLALLGTEWADLKVNDVNDTNIASDWLSRMLTAGLVNSSEDNQ